MPLKHSVVVGILKQLFALLHYLKKYKFFYGTPRIQFKKEIVSYIYQGMTVACPVTLKLTDLSYAGCSVIEGNANSIEGNVNSIENNANSIDGNKEKLRLYPRSVVAEEELKKRNLASYIQIKDKNFSLLDPSKHVKSMPLFMHLSAKGEVNVPFDAYSLLSSLMCERAFYITVTGDKQLNYFWKHLWLPEQLSTITERIQTYHDHSSGPNTSQQIIKLLSGLDLRSDLIEFGFQTLLKL